MTRKSLAWVGAVAVLVAVFSAGFATSAFAIDPWYGTCPTTVCSDMTGLTFANHCYRWPDGVNMKCEVYTDPNNHYARCFTFCQLY